MPRVKTKRKGKIKKPARKIKKSRPIKRPAMKVKKPKRKPQEKLKVPVSPKENKVFVGTVEHFFTEISVGVILLKKPLKTGDTISIQGATTNFKQKVESMQVDRKPVQEGRKGQSVGL